ncbi:alpha/beta fold hydrolase [Myceligenerans pegani]|uniref:Alpha/beta hydrolase n=1 Tax=Myceligenerans pegani TaxID=2776917 RepID=A0ABR9MYD0_9MICO|nr:alpha/beta hydrolase [Myceligenerans sp. TRM 65318]MBE1875934.1 alpha/beta hydrolase [Myceligenerans sp. TRM 65318]MBE3018205.1 alpha/beta hydrolase [Myceligenerans sp. TRM 65318]
MTGTSPLNTINLREGIGLPLVLLHGFPLDVRMWAACAEALPPGVSAIGVDLPGAGHSDLDGAPPGLEHSAERVHDTLRGMGVGNAIVVGLSMGGYVALALADLYPGFVAGLGLVDTKSVADAEDARANRHRIANAVEETQTVDAVLGMPAALLSPTSVTERRHLFPLLESWIRSQSPAGIAWMQRAMAARPDRTPVLEKYDAPVAVVVGEHDALSPRAQAEHMVAAAKKAGADVTLTEVPDAGHMAPVEDPATVAAALTHLHERVRNREHVRSRRRVRNR